MILTATDFLFFSWFIPFILLFFSMICFHEVGHLLYFWIILKRKVKPYFFFESIKCFGIRIGKEEDYFYLTKTQNINLYVAGIVSGFIPNLIYIPTEIKGFVILIVSSILYIAGCSTDIKNIIKLKKENGIL